MNNNKLKSMYGSTPESFKHRISFALKKTEEAPMKKFTARTILIAALCLVVATAAYAAFSSQVAEYFGRQYGDDMQSWLENGDVAVAGSSYTANHVTVTVDEVVYRSHGLYGVGTIRAADDTVVLLPDDHSPDDVCGVDVHGAGGEPVTPAEGAPTYAQVAQDKGAKLLSVTATPMKVAVDGGTALSPESIGSNYIPQSDGSIYFSFELSDGVSIAEGSTYSLTVELMTHEVNAAGEWLEGSEERTSFTMEITPTPMTTEAQPTATEAAPSPAVEAERGAPSILVPDEYTQIGTLPIYSATARDFTATVDPAWFNTTGIAESRGYSLTFNDEAVLELGPEALFYSEKDGTYNANFAHPDQPASILPKDAMSSEIYTLAGRARVSKMDVAPENETLTSITLADAKAALNALLEKLGLKGYTYDYVLDMSTERIQTLGDEENERILAGNASPNSYTVDYTNVTTEDEGYYFACHSITTTDDSFSVYAFVTSRGVVRADIRDMYEMGDVLRTPETLVDAQTVMDQLPRDIASSRFPDAKVAQIVSVTLTYAPARAEDKADGMIFVPAWSIVYKDVQGAEQGYDCCAVYNAVDGTLLDAMFI